MDLNKLTAEKDWVSKQNENIDQLSVKSERLTSITVVNGWSVVGADNYVMSVPGLDNTLKILHVHLLNTSFTPGQPQDILKVPDELGAGTFQGVSMRIPLNNYGHFSGFLALYFTDSTTLVCNLIALDGQTQAQRIDESFSFLYW